MKYVSDIMTDNPIVVSVPGSRNDAINKMVKNGLTGLPVVKSTDGTLVGIVSRRDVFRKFNEDQLSLIMKKDIKTISPDATVEDATEIFTKLRIHRLPVVQNGKLVGIVTPTDLLDVVIKKKMSVTAEDVITTTCVTAYEGAPLSYVVHAMRISDVPAMPVINESGKLTGIITDRDLFVDQVKDMKALKEMGISDAYESLAGYRNVLPLFYTATDRTIPEHHVVRDHMVRDPLTVFKKTSVSEVAKHMKIHDFGQIPVRDSKDDLVGMVYDVDVISALCRN
ncbi:MAG: CBS domain-containing protein [Methanomassiliicoccaceae archaeon]|jgi:CBS domain-containing protein|nr:CBS domain-containing protein [Methanomassiliicoccaceae archaeon]